MLGGGTRLDGLGGLSLTAARSAVHGNMVALLLG